MTSATAEMPTVTTEATDTPAPKRRGRPPGSKNKPKISTMASSSRTKTRATSAPPTPAPAPTTATTPERAWTDATMVLIEPMSDNKVSFTFIDDRGKQHVYQSTLNTVLDRR